MEYLIKQYPLDTGALEIQYIEEFFGEFPRKKTAHEIMRRLCDRVANEIVLALAAGAAPPAWAVAALDEMPERMAETTRRERDAERAAVDHIEAVLLRPLIGQDFDGVVTDVRDGRATVQIADPAVVAPLDGDGVEPGTRVRARLTEADPVDRKVRFSLVTA